VASEDVVYMLDRAGIATGMDLNKLVTACDWLTGVMGKRLPGMVGHAPPFPKAA
jgi:hydroxymethylglutaryl-CoA lyase